MPKRFVDGEALWSSDSLNRLPNKFRAEYANLIPLAHDNGVFECNPKIVWTRVYSYNRPDVTVAKASKILEAFSSSGMLFRWSFEGKTFGFFTKIDKNEAGRLPPPSRRFTPDNIPDVPQEQLALYLKGVIDSHASVTVTSSYGNASVTLPRFGKERLGKVWVETEKDGTSFSPFSEREEPEQAQSPVDTPNRGAGAEPRITEEKREEESNPVDQTTDQQSRSLGTISMPVPGAQLKASAKPRQNSPAEETLDPLAEYYCPKPSTRLHQELHPLMLTDGDFDALDFAFSRTEEFGGLEPREIRRVVYYQWRVRKNKYWSSGKGRINSASRLKAALPEMAKQVPDDYRVPGWTTSKIPVADPACKECEGIGSMVIGDRAYPEGMYQTTQPCECVITHPAPWRLQGLAG